MVIVKIFDKEIDISFAKIWEADEEFLNRRKKDGKKEYRNKRRIRNRMASHSRARNRV